MGPKELVYFSRQWGHIVPAELWSVR